jgi:putative acetyltransferase
MSLTVRPAMPADGPAIRALLLAAFPTPAEALLVSEVERDGDDIVSLVAEAEGEIVGHLLLSRMAVVADGEPVRALGLAPLAVLPGHQGSGIGTRLIEGGIAIARATGEALIFVLGEPDYYRRFGFCAESAAPFASPYAGPYFMALALVTEPAAPAAGSAAYPPAFARLP